MLDSRLDPWKLFTVYAPTVALFNTICLTAIAAQSMYDATFSTVHTLSSINAISWLPSRRFEGDSEDDYDDEDDDEEDEEDEEEEDARDVARKFAIQLPLILLTLTFLQAPRAKRRKLEPEAEGDDEEDIEEPEGYEDEEDEEDEIEPEGDKVANHVTKKGAATATAKSKRAGIVPKENDLEEIEANGDEE